MMIIKRSISDTICGGISNCENSKKFLDAIEHKFKRPDKLEMGIF